MAKETITLVREVKNEGKKNERIEWNEFHPDSDVVVDAIGTSRLISLDTDGVANVKAELLSRVTALEGQDPHFDMWEVHRVWVGFGERERRAEERGFDARGKDRYLQVYHRLEPKLRKHVLVKEDMLKISRRRPAGWRCPIYHMDKEKVLSKDELNWINGRSGRILPLWGELIVTRFPHSENLWVERDPERCRRLTRRFMNRMKKKQEERKRLEKLAKRKGISVRAVRGFNELDRMFFTTGVRLWPHRAAMHALEKNKSLWDGEWNYPGSTWRQQQRGATVELNWPNRRAPYYNQWAGINSAISLTTQLRWEFDYMIGKWAVDTTPSDLKPYLSVPKKPVGEHARGMEVLGLFCRMIPKSIERLVKREEWCPEAHRFIHRIIVETKYRRLRKAHRESFDIAVEALRTAPTTVDQFKIDMEAGR